MERSVQAQGDNWHNTLRKKCSWEVEREGEESGEESREILVQIYMSSEGVWISPSVSWEGTLGNFSAERQ